MIELFKDKTLRPPDFWFYVTAIVIPLVVMPISLIAGEGFLAFWQFMYALARISMLLDASSIHMQKQVIKRQQVELTAYKLTAYMRSKGVPETHPGLSEGKML